MKVSASLVAWPKGQRKEDVVQPIRLTIEAPPEMFPSSDDPEMVALLVSFSRGLGKLVNRRTGISLRWGMEGRQ
jgi:hypothetical protein